MKPLNVDDLTKVCRGCLCKNGEMRPLFGSFLDNMLQTVAEIEVKAGDGLPELMCVPCVLQVSRAFNFKKQCQRSDQQLRQYFQCNDKCDSHTIDGDIQSDDVESFTLIDTVQNDDGEIVTDSDIENVVTAFEESHTDNSYDVQFTDDNEQDNNNSNKCLLIVSNGTELDAEQLVEQITLDASNVCDLNNENISFTSNENLLTNQLNSIDVHHMNNESILIKEIDNDENESNGYDSELELQAEQITNDLIENIYFETKANESETNEMMKENKIENFSTQTKLQCNECNLYFDTISAKELHLMSVHKSIENAMKKSFECPECHKVFAENKILNRHLKIHNPIKKHVCSECNMSFSESSNLTKHMKKHTGELRNIVGKPNLCAVCGKGFKWSSSLSKHMKHHTGHKILRCQYCPKYYVEARSLNIHLRKHTGEKPFKCDICKKDFTQMGNLEKHLRVHTGERPYKCPICGKGFSQSGYVTIHLRTHTGEKPYVCADCGKAFAGSNTLAIHRRTHTGERPYPCTQCDKTFARHETAVIHIRTHTGEKPHICQICSRGFTSSGHLTGHMRSHSGIKTHACEICNKRFAGSSSLKVHMKIHIERTTNSMIEIEQNAKTTAYECNICKLNIPISALKSSEELQAYDHQIIDNVLICSKVESIIDHTKLIDEIEDDNSTNILLANVSDSELIDDGQNVIINLSDLK